MWCIRLPCKFSAAAWQNFTVNEKFASRTWSLGCDKVLDAEISQWQKHRSLERLGSLVWPDRGEFPIRIGIFRVMRQFVSICSDKSSPAFSSSRKVFLFFLPKANTPCIPRTDRSPRRRRACIGRTLYLHLARTRGGLMGSILLCKVENQVSRILCYFQTKY